MINYLQIHPLLYSLAVLVFSTVISLFVIPSILHVAQKRHLYDDIGHFRKQHDHGIPRLGGVAIFVSFTITSLLLGMTDKSLPINYLLAACIMMFSLGLKDDMYGVHSTTKFYIQFIAAAILVILGDIRLNSLHGVFGIQQLPYLPSVILSVLLITFIVNAFNLIDGIDGLAAALGIMANGTFAILFFYLHQYQLAIVACAMTGAIIGFIRFNLTPAKIFMGDTGSLLIGLISSILAIKFIETSNFSTDSLPRVNSAPALTFAILIVPIFDTLRVFTLRVLKGKSPFTADRNHIHHRLLELGLNHLQATVALVAINIAFLVLVVALGEYSTNTMLIVTMATTSMLLNWLLTFLIRAKNTQTYSLAHVTAVTIDKKRY